MCAIFYARALELGKDLPVSPGQLDLGEQGGEATVWVVTRYHMARALDRYPFSDAHSSFLIDLAILMTDIARPHRIFLADASGTAADVASRLLRWEGWNSDLSAFSEWKARTRAVDPASPDAAIEYLDLLRHYWVWVGLATETDLDEEEVVKAVAIPEAILKGLTRRCT